MTHSISISEKSSDPSVNLALDTLEKNKQALIFVNTRRVAKAQAERIAKIVKTSDVELINLSEAYINTLR